MKSKLSTTPAPSSSGSSTTRRTFLGLLVTLAGVIACRLGSASPPAPTGEATSGPTVSPSATTPSITPPPTSTPQLVTTATPLTALPSIIVDGHEDIAWNWLEFGRGPTESALETRAREADIATPSNVGERTTGLPEWLQGRVGVIFATLYVMPQRHAYSALVSQVYATPEEAHARAAEQLESYKDLAVRTSQLRLITTSQELGETLETWTLPGETPTVGLVMLMEGADPIREPDEVRWWHDQGLRIVGPAWASTRYAGGTGEPGRLTDLGRQLLQTMAEVGMILDLSHMAEEAYLEAVDTYPGEMIASHSNPRAFLPTDRGLSDDMIRHLADRGGVVGVVLFNRFLVPGWQVGDSRAEVPIQTVVEAIDYITQLTGSAAHVGIGSDFDGGFGAESIPAGMDTIADLLQIAEALTTWGYSPVDVEAVMNGNWLRILRNSLPQG